MSKNKVLMKFIRISPGLMMCVFAVTAATNAQNQITIGASKDNTLYQDLAGSTSNGAGEHFFTGRTGIFTGGVIRRGLIAFDIADTIPPGSTITNVTLTLSMSRTISLAQTVELRRVLADWGEGTSNDTLSGGGGGGGGAPATAGDATWIHTFYDTSFWPNVGGDFSSIVSAAESVSAIGFYIWDSTPQMVSDVQAWLDTPSTNFGWLLLGNEGAVTTTKRFDTRENINNSLRPALTVTYTGPVGVEDDSYAPTEFVLHQNYPNPFNPSTKIRFSIPPNPPFAKGNKGVFVLLRVYDVLGREVATLVNGELPAGEHEVEWKPGELSSGIYFYRLNTTSGSGKVFASTKKMMLMK